MSITTNEWKRGRTMSEKLTAEKGQGMVRKYDWEQLLIIPFGIKNNLSDAACKVEQWIKNEEADWCADDESSEDDANGTINDKNEAKPSYLIIGCWQSRIQGPVVYVLVAGATDNLAVSVEDWNKSNQENCIRIRFKAFGEDKVRRRRGMLAFLRGFFDVGCVAFARVHKRHRLSDRELRSNRAQL
jgi:hypothetical protein